MSDKPMTPLMVTYARAGEMLGICPRAVWQLVSDKEIRAVRVGRSVRIPLTELEKFVAERSRRG